MQHSRASLLPVRPAFLLATQLPRHGLLCRPKKFAGKIWQTFLNRIGKALRSAQREQRDRCKGDPVASLSQIASYPADVTESQCGRLRYMHPSLRVQNDDLQVLL